MEIFELLKVERYQMYATIIVRTLMIFFTRVFLWLYAVSLNLYEFNAKWKRPQKLPPIRSDVCKKSATELRGLLKSKQMTSRELVEQFILRINEVDHILNSNCTFNVLRFINFNSEGCDYALKPESCLPLSSNIPQDIVTRVVDKCFEEALQEADEIDDLIRSASNEEIEEIFGEKPLLGLPITVKETLAVKGMKHSSARSRVPVAIADQNAASVGRLRSAGAIPLVVSTAPELCLNLETVSRNGRTLNPYDTTRSTGGSSGGEAALLGSGASVIGLGSDISGSIRIPSMFCGVFGHKPTPGFVSVEGHIPSSSDPMWDYYFTVGPMVKRAIDLPLIYKCLVSEEDVQKLRLDENVDLSHLKVYYMFGEGKDSHTQTSPSKRVRTAIETAVQQLKSVHNCECEMVHLPYFVNSIKYNRFIVMMKGVENVYQRTEDPDDWDFRRMLAVMWKKVTLRTDANFGALLWGPMKYMGMLAAGFSSVDAELELKEYKQQFYDLLGDNAVFLYPTFPVEAQPHNHLGRFTFDVSYTSVFNVFGVPSTSCPISVPGQRGLPIGIQVAAAPGQDRLCFAVARALEECGGWVPPE